MDCNIPIDAYYIIFPISINNSEIADMFTNTFDYIWKLNANTLGFLAYTF